MVETSVVVLNYNGLTMLKKCLPSLLDQHYADYEIILIDNGSHDGTSQWVQANYPRHPRLKFHPLKTNTGFAGGNNYGVKRAKGEFIVLLNNDTQCPKDFLEHLIAKMKMEDKRTIGGALNINRGMAAKVRSMIFKRHEFVTMNLVGETVVIAAKPEEIEHGAISTFFTAGNGLCFRKSVYGLPFDENYFIYAEDVYICWKAWLIGGKVKTILPAKIMHIGGGSKHLTKQINKITVFNGMKNQVMNYLIFYSGWTILRTLPLFLVSQLGQVVHDPRKFVPKLKMYFWILTHARMIWKKRRAMQAKRKVSDSNIISQMSYKFFDDPYSEVSPWMRKFVPMVNWSFKLYCIIFRLKTKELVDA
jgi:N-acetylglucosaminyl-diphospho-decaprenol L-rhamnosyltransferase